MGTDKDQPNFHNNYQDIEAFLRAGGRRGVQYTPLIDGTYFINRWFATIEMIPKCVVPIGYVGVVVSFYGKKGADTSGKEFRHGERVREGEKGVWETALGPGKYAFNTSAGVIVEVPTTNFVLHWITGRSESHHFDDSLKSIELITADAYEPMLPLSLVVHIDYEKAPSVIQRFGDVKQLITQTLDPLLERLFPRRGPQEEHVGVDPPPRRDPAAGAGGAAGEVRAVRHPVRRRADRPAGEQAGRHEDREPAGAVAAAAVRRRAGRDLPEAAGGGRPPEVAQRGRGPGPIAGRTDQVAGADPHFREHRRRRVGQGPQGRGNDGRAGRGGGQAGPLAGRGRGRRGCWWWPRPRPSRPP